MSCLLDSRAVFFPSLGRLCSRLAFPVLSFFGAHSSSPSFRRLSFPSFLTRSNLRFPPRRGPPFGPSQFPLGSRRSLFQFVGPSHPCGRLCVVSFCFSPSPRPVLVLSSGWSSPLRFRATPLPWFACLDLGLGDFFSFCGLRWRGVNIVLLLLLSFWPPLPYTGASRVLFSMFSFASLLVVLAFPAFLDTCLSLASVSFALVFFSGA